MSGGGGGGGGSGGGGSGRKTALSSVENMELETDER